VWAYPTTRWELQEVNGNMTAWKGLHLANSVSKVLPCDQSVFCVIQHAEPFEEWDRQERRQLGLDDIHVDYARYSLDSNRNFDRLKELGGSSDSDCFGKKGRELFWLESHCSQTLTQTLVFFESNNSMLRSCVDECIARSHHHTNERFHGVGEVQGYEKGWLVFIGFVDTEALRRTLGCFILPAAALYDFQVKALISPAHVGGGVSNLHCCATATVEGRRPLWWWRSRRCRDVYCLWQWVECGGSHTRYPCSNCGGVLSLHLQISCVASRRKLDLEVPA
jgi:hypothetical protein